jgi:hypothetical protein
MNREWLQNLSVAGLCLLAMTTAPTTQAEESCPTCPEQACPMCPQPCPSSPGYCRTGCGNDCCLHAMTKWALCCNYYILPPDYGWNAPAKVPVVRRGVTYYRYWPEHWYGTSSPAAGEYRSYPQVYSPTDTTQLGYTYQQVPYWQPAPYRLPPPPVPSQWHVREPHHGYYGRWHSSYTPIHHHQMANNMFWMEPIGHQPAMMMPQPVPHMMPTPPAGPVGCPPAPEPAPAPKKLIPEPAAPAPTPDAPPPAAAPPAAVPADAPPPPAPAADGKTAAMPKSRLTTMFSRFRHSAD